MSIPEIVHRALSGGGESLVDLGSDLLSHTLAGYSLTKYYFPGSTKLKTAARTVVGGFLPDFDFGAEILTGGIITHRSLTHSWLAPFLAPAYSLFEKSKFTALKFGLAGTAAHLLIDATKTLEERAACMVVAMAGIFLTNSSRKDRYTLPID
jgi:membrane-bound metal-dependent hydrolase YbcI (DUF457 family)